MDNKNIEKWVKIALEQPVPVLRYTIKELRYLCSKAEIPVREITHLVERDPGLVVHILRASNNRSKSRLAAEITHVNQALRLMGTDQLTRLPDALPAVGDVLDEKTKPRLLATFDRAYHAARFATDWATLRRDMTPDEVFAAAQLHFLGEMILSIHAQSLLDKIAEVRIEEHVASEEAQYIVLGFTLNDLTQKIAEALQFPALVTEALSSENARYPRAYGIMLGVQLARSISFEGWYSPTTRQIQKQVAEWMDKPLDFIIARTHMIAAEIAREIPQYDTRPPARDLPLIIRLEEVEKEEAASHEAAAICLVPRLEILKDAVKEMTKFSPRETEAEDLLHHIVSAMHDGIGLNRVVFARYNAEENCLQGQVIKGAENDPLFNRFQISLQETNLFTHLLDKPQAVLVNQQSRAKFWPLVPGEFQKIISTNSFVAMSVFNQDKPYGIFYADRHSPNCQIESRSYNYFKTLVTHTSKVLQQLI